MWCYYNHNPHFTDVGLLVGVTQLAKVQLGYEPKQLAPDQNLHLWSQSHVACDGHTKRYKQIPLFSLLKAYEGYIKLSKE